MNQIYTLRSDAVAQAAMNAAAAAARERSFSDAPLQPKPAATRTSAAGVGVGGDGTPLDTRGPLLADLEGISMRCVFIKS